MHLIKLFQYTHVYMYSIYIQYLYNRYNKNNEPESQAFTSIKTFPNQY